MLKKRYRCRLGELDLVCLDGSTLVVVEVRARARGSVVDPTESVDFRKQRKLVRATRHLLMTHPQWSDRPLRFDVIAATDIDTDRPNVRWIKDAFEAGAA